MLSELNVNDVQKKDEPFRRWFQNEFFDLMVWYSENKEISGFQLSYNKGSVNEKCLMWTKKEGFRHYSVDDPVFMGRKKAPLLVSDGIMPVKEILLKFKESSINMEEFLQKFILEKIQEFDIQQNKKRKDILDSKKM